MEDLGLGVGDLLDRAEEAEMHGSDGGDDGDMRPDQPRQHVDLARMIHADLEHTETGALRHVGERERNAPMVVEGFERCMHRAARSERELQRFLRAGLAGAAGDRDHDRVGRARAAGAAERVQRFERIADADQPLLIA